MHADDVLISADAGGKVIRGSLVRVLGSGAGIVAGLGSAALLFHHLGVAESGRYIAVLSLVAIAGNIADAGLNITGSRELALRRPEDRPALMANFIGLRLAITPPALAALILFAVLAGYPQRMVVGTALAGTGLFIWSIADAVLLRLIVELRNAGVALVDFLRQFVTLLGVALLVLLGARLTPFFAVQIVVALVVVAVIPLVAGRGSFLRPRFDRDEQRRLLKSALPVAAAIVLGQIYFRLVIVIMSVVASAQQTGYFGASLRAMETLVSIPLLVAGVALPLLSAAARDDRVRMRYAISGLSQGAIIAGVLVALVTVRAAEPVMALIGGGHFRPAGAVLRIQVIALVFIGLYQLWTVALIALGRQRELILTNALALTGLAVFAAVLVPPLAAQGGAAASVLADALLAALVYWRLHRAGASLAIGRGFVVRLPLAAAIGAAVLFIPGLPDLVAAAAAGAAFLGVGYLIGMLPDELWAAVGRRGLLARGAGR